MKTIKELADELGVSKTAVRNHMDEEFRRKHTESNRKGSITIDSDGCKLIAESIGKKWEEVQTTAKNFPESSGNPENAVSGDMVALLQTTIETLRDQLAEKDTQLAEKDRQLKDLIETVKAQAQSINGAQALHAGTMQQIAGEVGTDAPLAQAEPVIQDETAVDADQAHGEELVIDAEAAEPAPVELQHEPGLEQKRSFVERWKKAFAILRGE